MTSAVVDSFTHRFPSSRWPNTMQPQRSATKMLMATMESWSDTDSDSPVYLRASAPKSIPMMPIGATVVDRGFFPSAQQPADNSKEL